MGIIIRHIYEAISTLPGNISPACSRACRKRQSQPGLLRPYRCPSSLPSMRHRQGEQSSWPLTKNSLLQLFHSTVKGQIQQLSIKVDSQVCALPSTACGHKTARESWWVAGPSSSHQGRKPAPGQPGAGWPVTSQLSGLTHQQDPHVFTGRKRFTWHTALSPKSVGSNNGGAQHCGQWLYQSRLTRMPSLTKMHRKHKWVSILKFWHDETNPNGDKCKVLLK